MQACNALIKLLLLSSFIFLFYPLASAAVRPVEPIIIDTDAGVDDVIAIAYLLKSPAVQVKAITIESNGIANCAPGFRNISGLLSLLNKTAIPLACGEEHPGQSHQFPPRLISESNNLSGSAELLPKTNYSVTHNAVKLLITRIQQSPVPVTILAIGPLTNIAEALQQQPEIEKNIRRIYIMGGAVHVPGNLQVTGFHPANTAAEWNIYLDPEAAKKVFSAHIAIALVPLDVTNKMPINWEFYQKLKQHHITPEANFIYELFKRNEKYVLSHDWYFWDPLAAVLVTQPSIATWQNEPLEILLKPELQSGAMIINQKKGHETRVCTDVNKAYFENLLLNVLN